MERGVLRALELLEAHDVASCARRMPTTERIRAVPGAQPLRSPPAAVWEKPSALNDTTLNVVSCDRRLGDLHVAPRDRGFCFDSV